MKTRKRIGEMILAVLLGVMLVVSANAATITITGFNGTYHSWGGGEFNASINSQALFQTFCIERNESLNFNVPYNFNFSTEAQLGGLGGPDPDPISSQTAYLFTNFAKGTLVDLASHTYSSSILNDQKGLQYALWYFEDELVDYAANGYSSALNFAIANGAENWINLSNAKANGTIYNVSVINPYVINSNSSITPKQSLLFVPEATALILFGSGLFGLIGYRRTRRMK